MGAVPLPAKVKFLSDPASYPHRPPTVIARETHWAWVFIASGLVYKMKKPSLRPSMDFRALAARKRACENELRVNRRFAPSIYRTVVPLVRREDGTLSLGGHGEVVEWLVEMRQLETADCMDARIAGHRLSAAQVAAVGQGFADFYSAALGRACGDAGEIYIRHLWAEIEETRSLFCGWECGVDAAWIHGLLREFERRLKLAEPEIRERASAGLIVDGHGDLRAEHVYIAGEIIAFDSLEFDDSMRMIDPYDEQNYLGLECEFLGADWVRPILLARLRATIGHEPSASLLAVYGAFRGLLRARICLAHLLDEVPMTPEIWPGHAQRYLRIAQRELASAT
jgi:aminoglycoside phosphotransferase family enzyme